MFTHKKMDCAISQTICEIVPILEKKTKIKIFAKSWNKNKSRKKLVNS